MVPLIEGLLDKGHHVTFIMPNTGEFQGFFPKGIFSENGENEAELLFFGEPTGEI